MAEIDPSTENDMLNLLASAIANGGVTNDSVATPAVTMVLRMSPDFYAAHCLEQKQNLQRNITDLDVMISICEAATKRAH